MKYRREIDGLRALAVIPVILFHAGFQAFSGGFVGVDVFFVISGYLITMIIISELDLGKFSIVNFYERRARRILPALFLVMIICIPFAYIWLLPSDIKAFSQSLIAVSAFSSNILFWRESGYFDTAAELKPLLHTWSLAVEEQYYVIFPLTLMLLWRLNKRWILISLAIIFFASLAIAQWASLARPTAAFYLLHTRGWELLIGAFAAFYLSKSNRKEFDKSVGEIGGVVGIFLILYAIFSYDKTTPFPGLYALAPTIGALLIILFATQQTLVGRFIGNKIFVGIGLISYSAYLWHQPLFAFTRHSDLIEPGAFVFVLLLVVALILAYFTYSFVEKPFRNSAVISRQSVLIFSLLGASLFISLGLFGSKTDYVNTLRFNEKEISILKASQIRTDKFDLLGAESESPKWMLLGDSHANTLQEAFDNILKKSKQSSLVKTIDGCPPALNLIRYDIEFRNNCHKNYTEAIKIIKEKSIKNVLIAARFALYVNSDRFNNLEGGIEIGVTKQVIYDLPEFRGTIRDKLTRSNAIKSEFLDYVNSLSGMGVNVFVVSSIPEVGWDVPRKALSLSKIGLEVKTKRSSYDTRVLQLNDLMENLSKIPNVSILNSSEVFCDREFCFATRNGMPLYSDTNHLSQDGAMALLDHFKDALMSKN
jgi:peptidoglycan/LPS O-acetylase OafA/YrhL